jgi:CheY-like chemotaxis protein
MAYAGKAKGILEEVDTSIIVKEVCQNLTFAIPGNLTLECDLADRVPFWKGDASQIYQVLMNLVMNAFEAFPEGAQGTITLRTRGEGFSSPPSGPGTWVLPSIAGRYAVLEVADTGGGMTPEVLHHAFEPFFTTKATGRGLGLAAVHGMLRSLGGGLWVRSIPGRGTSFKVFLPAMVEPRLDSGGEILSTWKGQGLILVVDPERTGLGQARAMAERFGFSILEARGGLEAVEIFRHRHGELALVLLDRKLMGVGTAETYRRLQLIDGFVPVVFTGRYDSHVQDTWGPAPPGTLVRPYRQAEFQGVLVRALEGRPGSTPE